jgi:hypothetical protein
VEQSLSGCHWSGWFCNENLKYVAINVKLGNRQKSEDLKEFNSECFGFPVETKRKEVMFIFWKNVLTTWLPTIAWKINCLPDELWDLPGKISEYYV